MKIFYTPQVRDKNIYYKIEKEVIIVEFENETETYDFSGMPDGNAEEIISEVFDFNPIISAKRENGELWIEVLNFITENATEKERFPEWEDTNAKD